jgi:cytochrome c-type biogenesis protein
MAVDAMVSQLVIAFRHGLLVSGPNQWLAVLALSFAGGVVSSLLPCTIGMLPIMVGLIGGSQSASKQTVILRCTCFILGLSTVMTVLGLLASSLGLAFGSMLGEGWYGVIAVLAITIGLSMLGVFTLPLPPLLQRLPQTPAGNIVGPFVLGLAFGSAASPCGTPFLTGILGLISQQKQLALGALSLFVYGVGQGLLLLVAGLFTGLLKHLAVMRHVGQVLTKASGVLFIASGVLILLQIWGVLGILLLQLQR